MRCLSNNIFQGLFRAVGLFRQFAFQVCGLIPVDHTPLGQFIDHGSHFRELLPHFFSFRVSQVADRIAGGFAVIAVSFTPFYRLAGIFFCSTVIGHSINLNPVLSGRAKVRSGALITKFSGI